MTKRQSKKSICKLVGICAKKFQTALFQTLLSFIPDLMRSGSKPDPSIIEGDDKFSLVQLHVDLPASKQHQRVDGHHAAVPDEDPARFHLLVVNQVGAVVVADLRHKEESRGLSLQLAVGYELTSFLSKLTV